MKKGKQGLCRFSTVLQDYSYIRPDDDKYTYLHIVYIVQDDTKIICAEHLASYGEAIWGGSIEGHWYQ